MSNPETPFSPTALMLLSSHCVHCPSVLDSLSKMIKSGEIAELQVINLEQNPDAMQTYKVRSVPWVRIGKHELTGVQTLEALQQRAQWAKDEHNSKNNINLVADYDFKLSEGQADTVIQSIKNAPENIDSIVELLSDSGTVLSTRIGIGVVFEEFAGSDMLKSLIPTLGKLTQNEDSRIRADAFHYLGLSQDGSALPFLQQANDETDPEILEIISDSIEALTE